MRDIWATPPGGLTPEIKRKARWQRVRAVVAMGMSVSLLTGAGVYATMKQSTPVSAETALQEFRSHSGNGGSSGAGEETTKHATHKKEDHVRSSTVKSNRGKDVTGVAAGTTAQGSSDEPQSAVEESGSAAPSGDPPERSNDLKLVPPEEGVYTWSIDGYEEAPGVQRDLPERSQRVITHDGPRAWTEHHIFSEQREEWFGLEISEEGVATNSSRNRVEMGPVTVDKTVVFNPPVFVSRFPFKVGETWEGSWTGKTSGEYTGKTFEHTFLTIGGEKVEVFGTEVIMHMRGDVEGEAITRSWVAPEYSLVVKQYQKMTVAGGPGDYKSEWTGQVESVHPQT